MAVNIKDLYDAVNESRKENADSLQSFRDEVNTKFESLTTRLDEKYAPKWVERFTVGLIGTVMVTVLLAVLYNIMPEAIAALGR